ncbi:MAG: alpha-glucan family phosphorylase [Bdellovibrionota bacterium]|jgi:starch phosphorylase
MKKISAKSSSLKESAKNVATCKTSKKTCKDPSVAYFCMEYGLDYRFQIYSGGLGILAGDIIKAARDSKRPMVALGILWKHGYARQAFTEDGKLVECYSRNEYDFLEDTGVIIRVRIRGEQVACKVWKCDCFGNVPLYLLDADLPENPDRFVTTNLYGGNDEDRIAQEIILGIGGVRALRALGIKVDLYHFNDCHPLFAGIELIREKMDCAGQSFDNALANTKQEVIFTTHTPVPAGNEQHKHELLQYMGAYNGLTYDQMLRLGGDPFNMAAAGLRISRKASAVAQLHGKTARKMWSWVTDGAEILAITNGVHNATWQSKDICRAMSGKADLWEVHQAAKRELLDEIKATTGQTLDEDVLLLGFARRVTGYKRHTLIFKSEKVIQPLLKGKKLAIVFAGKTHPRDLDGRRMIEEILQISKKCPNSVVFLPNYDMRIGALLTRGCDVWLNNPVRPREASGTSGMKAAMNGVLNCSVLDGWWDEGFKEGKNGWEFGNRYEGPDADKVDSSGMYKVLMDEVIPTYYENRKKWIKMMKSSIETSQEQFSAKRMVDEYYKYLYS